VRCSYEKIAHRRHVTILLAAVLAAFAGPAARAASVSYFMEQNNAGLPVANYLQVTISDGLNGDIDFRVETLPAFSALNPGTNFGLQSFGFNFDSNLVTVTKNNIANLDPATWKVNLSMTLDGYGEFDIVPKGTGSDRTPLLLFSVVNVEGDTPLTYASVLSGNNAGGGSQLFASHVAGFDYNGTTSAFFAGSTAVPLPAAAWLLLSGVTLLRPAGRRAC